MTASQSINFADQAYTYDGLFNLTGPELVKLHNAAAPKVGVETTKRFGDKVAGAKRTWAVLQRVGGDNASVTVEKIVVPEAERDVLVVKPVKAPKEPKQPKVAKAPKEPKAPKEKKERAPRGMYMMFHARPVDEQKPIKPETMRGKLFKLLSREYGATFEQLLAGSWADKEGMDDETKRKTCYEATRLIHYFNGFGLYHADNDHVFVWSTAAELKAIKEKHDPKAASKEA